MADPEWWKLFLKMLPVFDNLFNFGSVDAEDLAEATKFAEGGHIRAMSWLACYYGCRWAPHFNEKKERFWRIQGAVAGDPSAVRRLEQILKEPRPQHLEIWAKEARKAGYKV